MAEPSLNNKRVQSYLSPLRQAESADDILSSPWYVKPLNRSWISIGSGEWSGSESTAISDVNSASKLLTSMSDFYRAK